MTRKPQDAVEAEVVGLEGSLGRILLGDMSPDGWTGLKETDRGLTAVAQLTTGLTWANRAWVVPVLGIVATAYKRCEVFHARMDAAIEVLEPLLDASAVNEVEELSDEVEDITFLPLDDGPFRTVRVDRANGFVWTVFDPGPDGKVKRRLVRQHTLTPELDAAIGEFATQRLALKQRISLMGGKF